MFFCTQAKPSDLAKNWGLSYMGNLTGSLFMVGLVAASGVMAYNALPVTLATYKCGLGFMEVRCRQARGTGGRGGPG